MATGIILMLLGLEPPAFAQPPVWQFLSDGLEEVRLKVVAVAPDQPRRLYAGSSRAVAMSEDGGRTWRTSAPLPGGAELTGMALDPFDSRHVLAATTNGLYGSVDGGRLWTRLFRGTGEGESRCHVVRFHPTHRHAVFLGTGGGLFFSADGGRQWQALGAGLTHQAIVDVVVDPHDPARLYALSEQGVFAGSLEDPTWHRLLAFAGVEALSATLEEIDEEAQEEAAPFGLPTSLAIDPQDPQRLYLATTHGLRVSGDGGMSWQRATALGLGAVPIRHLLLQARSPTTAYAATSQGVARYLSVEERWETLDAGLPTRSVHQLAATASKLFAATDQGLYALDLTEEQLLQGNWPSPRELLGNFVHEPTIGQVQQTAMRYAEVEPEKIQRWRRQASMKALLPTLDVSANPNLTDFRHWDSGTNPDSLLKGERDTEWNTSITWDLGDLIWNDDQTSIDVRSKLMVQLRDDIMDDVTRTFFARRRAQVELLTAPPGDPKAQLDKELRLQELTARLDGLTGGWFSRQLEFNGKR